MVRKYPTIAHWMFAELRRALPRPLARRIRAVGTGLLAPLYFSLDTGHFRSSLIGCAVDKRGNPIPWFTYPIIDALAASDFAQKSVLEFGAGQSTLWWSHRAKTVISFEPDEDWFQYVESRAPSNVAIYLMREFQEAEAIVCGKQFDVIVIDGIDRVEASRLAVSVVAPTGAIILDNSEQPWGGRDYPLVSFFRREGFSRADFYGYAPGVSLAHCTSVFFRGDCFLFRGERAPVPKRWVMPAACELQSCWRPAVR